jgi:filamentous hemagglutinin family protein
VQAGSASIARTGTATTITQTSDRTVIDWQSFDIAVGESTRFVQPSADSVALNRVVGSAAQASKIAGTLTANGQVVLVNPNGVLFEKTAQVDVAGLVASTANVTTADFMAGRNNFTTPGQPTASVENQGAITVRDAGLAAFVAPTVVNSGTITARLGKVQLAGAEAFTLDLYGDGLIQLAVTPEQARSLVINSGFITADGGQISLTATQAKAVVDSVLTSQPDAVVLQTGIVQANTTDSGQTGRVRILATAADGTAAGAVAISGVVQARTTAAALSSAPPAASRQQGGTVQISGRTTVVQDAVIDVSGQDGGGQLRLGGEYLGGRTDTPLPGLKVKNLKTPNSQTTWVGGNVLLLGDALERGDGGHLVTWADGNTGFYGVVQARGGRDGGNGGFVEVSGKGYLDMQGMVDLTPRHASGQKGTLLLDPTDIVISNFAPNDSSVSANLKLWLDASDASTVTLAYSTDGLGTTASATAGTNTITTAANVSANLAVGARIRLTAAGTTTTANTLGSDTYTIAAISGTTITTVETIAAGGYSGQTLFRGLVSQWSDKSTNSNTASQGTASAQPLWIAANGGQNGNSIVKFDGTDYMNFVPFNQSITQSVFSTYQTTVNTGWQNLLNRTYTNNGPATYAAYGDGSMRVSLGIA